MNFEDFKKLVKEIKNDDEDYFYIEKNIFDKDANFYSFDDCLTYEGNYMGDSWDYPDSSKYPTEIKKIDLFLEKYVQNISFIQYKKLTNKYRHISHETRDIYSNTVYKITYISIKEFYDFLLENKLI
jgi:hypothetical protein